jgi:hypothetical protein
MMWVNRAAPSPAPPFLVRKNMGSGLPQCCAHGPSDGGGSRFLYASCQIGSVALRKGVKWEILGQEHSRWMTEL